MIQSENNMQLEQPTRMSAERYPAEVRKLGQRAMQLFDSLQESFMAKGSNWADSYFQAASRTPEMYRAELRRTFSRFEPI